MGQLFSALQSAPTPALHKAGAFVFWILLQISMLSLTLTEVPLFVLEIKGKKNQLNLK